MLEEWMHRKESKVMTEIPGEGEKLQVIATVLYKGALYGIFSKETVETVESEESMPEVCSICIEEGQIAWKETKKIDLKDDLELAKVVAYILNDELLEERICPHYEVVCSEKFPGYYLHDRRLYTQWELEFLQKRAVEKPWKEWIKKKFHFAALLISWYDSFLCNAVVKLKLPVWMTEEIEVEIISWDDYEVEEYEE